MGLVPSRGRGRDHAPLIVPALTLLIALLTAALPAAAAAASAPKPFVVCDRYGGQAGPDIAGSMVVWTDNRRGNLDIFGRDLVARKDYAICTDKAQQDNPSVTRRVTGPGRIGYVAVWVDRRNHPGGLATDIYGRDITAGREFVVSRSATVKWYPEILDDWVVWTEADDPAGPYRIKARDLRTKKTRLVGSGKVLSPVAIDSRRVDARTVYTVVYTSGKGDISACDLPDGKPFVVSRRATFEWMPDISRNRVVWWESGGRIMLRDLRTGRRMLVGKGARPRIHGALVAWDGGGHGGEYVISYVKGARIRVRDVRRKNAVVVIGQKDLTCLFPALSGRRVVWESGPARRVLTHVHIYGANLP